MLFNFNNQVRIDIINPPKEHGEYLKNELHFIEESKFLKSNCDVIISFDSDLKMNKKNNIKVKAPLGFDKDGVYLYDQNNELARINFYGFSEKTTEIVVSNNFNIHFLYILVLYLLSFKAIKHKGTFFHASAIKYKGRNFLFPAWRHVGKTNLMLSFLRSGAELIADDGVILYKNGEFIPFSKRMNLLYYNFSAFPELIEKVSPKMKELKIFMDKTRSGEYEFSENSQNLFLKLIREKVSNKSITGFERKPKKEKIDIVVHLNKKMDDNSSEIVINDIDIKNLVTKSIQISDFELSHFISAYNISSIVNNNLNDNILNNINSQLGEIFLGSFTKANNLFELNFNHHLQAEKAKRKLCDYIDI